MMPGSIGFPVLGEMEFARDPESYLRTRVRRYGAVFRAYILGAPTVFACSYESAMDVLWGSVRGGMVEFVGSLYPGGNAALEDEGSEMRAVWQDHLGGALSCLEGYQSTISTVVKRHADALAATATVRCGVRGARVDLYVYFKEMMTELMIAIVLGQLTAAEMRAIRALCSDHFNGIVAAPVRLEIFGRKSARDRALVAHDALIAKIRSIIRSARADGKRAECVSVLARLLSNGSGPEYDADLARHLLVLLSAAVPKSLASALMSLFMRLSGDTNKQLVAQLSTCGDASVELDACIHETLRMHPPLLGGLRQTHASPGQAARIGSHAIAPRTRLFYSTLLANHDPAAYPSASKFHPQRWIAGAGAPSTGCPFAPPSREAATSSPPPPLTFGAGARLCPGRDLAWIILRAVASATLARFDVTTDVNAAVAMRYLPVLRPQNVVMADVVVRKT